MAETKHNPTQRAEIKSYLAAWEMRGYTQVEMVRLLEDRYGYKITQQQVSHYLRRVRDEYNKREDDSRKVHVERMRETYKTIRKMAWEAWDRSAEDAVKVVEESEAVIIPRGGDPNGALESAERVRRIVTITGRLPANEYLKTIMDTLEAERELLGLDQPVESASTNVNVTNVVKIEQLTKCFKDEAMQEALELNRAPQVGLKELPQSNGVSEAHE